MCIHVHIQVCVPYRALHTSITSPSKTKGTETKPKQKKKWGNIIKCIGNIHLSWSLKIGYDKNNVAFGNLNLFSEHKPCIQSIHHKRNTDRMLFSDQTDDLRKRKRRVVWETVWLMSIQVFVSIVHENEGLSLSLSVCVCMKSFSGEKEGLFYNSIFQHNCTLWGWRKRKQNILRFVQLGMTKFEVRTIRGSRQMALVIHPSEQLLG